MSINDSVSVDLGVCNTGAIGNNDLVVAVQRWVLSNNHVRVTEKVRACQKRWPGGRWWRPGATPRPNSEYAECQRVHEHSFLSYEQNSSICRNGKQIL